MRPRTHVSRSSLIRKLARAATGGINNPTTTKQGVGPTTGIVVEASTPTTKHYWHGTLP